MHSSSCVFIRNAIFSVTDKTGIDLLAKDLFSRGVQLFSTGQTAKFIEEQNIPVNIIQNYTQFPEILGGRVKTLHPKIFGGILARGEQDEATLSEHNIQPFQLVVVNLYPFQEVIQKTNDFKTAIENIDIGGVSLIRAAAKNFEHVIILVDTKDYINFLTELDEKGGISYESRLKFAAKAFEIIAEYDQAIADDFKRRLPEAPLETLVPNQNEKIIFPACLNLTLEKQTDLRYGENPHQAAAFYLPTAQPKLWQLLQGKPLSYTNLVDANAAFESLQLFTEQSAVVIVKHATPCGLAVGKTLTEAYEKAFLADSTSAFGGIISLNQAVDADVASKMLAKQFIEVVIAPDFTKEAMSCFAEKPNLRVVKIQTALPRSFEFRNALGGMLVQERDITDDVSDAFRVVTQQQPTAEQWQDLAFAWRVVRYVKSNAIVLAKNNMTIGLGGGQTSRVDAVRLAAEKASDRGHRLNDVVLASDAFFPFKDSIELVKSLGISAIIQPGGSIRDKEVIAACNDFGIAMVFTGIRHFRH